MKTIFITGASSGIGREAAQLFAANGWQVVATMRNTAKAGELAELQGVTLMALDLTNPEQIRETCQKALEQFDIDVLFNNAGYGIMGPFEKLPENEIRKLFDTDVIGTMLVTQQFVPHFKQRHGGVILTTTSLAGIVALPRDGAYGAAKRAQQGMVESLYYELKPFGVQVKAMIPGGTKTNFQTPVNILDGYEDVARRQREYLLQGNSDFPEPAEAAQVVWTAATDGEDRINYPTDSVCQKLYDQYVSMNVEDFKRYFYGIIYGEKQG
ncbi:SDR family oxidoreductase [Paraburkholderia youngii]|uniref:SDR family oxidoreductase n=1 Tax=Paraburkholderia youngii TaxID=2782701 RepID=UPI003D2326C4